MSSKSRQTADAVVLTKIHQRTHLLAIKRKNPPYKDSYALPGGFIDDTELPLNACLRELEEETGLRLEHEQAVQLSPRKLTGRDPRGDTETFPFLFWLDSSQKVNASDDAEEAKWIDLEELPPLAFDHGAILCEALGKFWKEMPGHHSLLSHVGSIFGYDERLCDEMAFYGGSFDPWHEGHAACVDACPDKRCLVIVPDHNPFKKRLKYREDFCYFSAYKDLLNKIKNYGCRIYPGFYGLEIPNPTSSWLPQTSIKSRSLLMGEDNFISLKNWINVDLLLKYLTKIYVVPRKVDQEALSMAIDWFRRAAPLVQVTRLPEHPYEDLSSTQLRDKRQK